MSKHKRIERIENKQFDSWLASTGYLFPHNELELERFNRLYEDYSFKTDALKINVEAILNNTLKRRTKIIKLQDISINKEIESLRMVARKGQHDIPKDIIDKMLEKHKKRDHGQ